MATTHDYIEYLDEKIEIAPTGTAEELNAAETIASVMRQHGVTVNLEEFTTNLSINIVDALSCVLALIGFILLALPSGLAKFFGFVLVILSVVVFYLKGMGNIWLNKLGRGKSKSQNVVAKHEGSGENAGYGVRPIVIVAHYNTPRINFLYDNPQIARFIPLYRSNLLKVEIALIVLAFIQILPFIPSVLKVILWLVAFVIVAINITWEVARFMELRAEATFGANDNKSGVAAMLSILNKVRPIGFDDVPHYEENLHQDEDSESEDEEYSDEDVVEAVEPPAPVYKEVVEEVEGTRHGEEVLRSLGILPEDCEIEYLKPRVEQVLVSEPPAVSPAPVTVTTKEAEYEEEAPEDEKENFATSATNAFFGMAQKIKASGLKFASRVRHEGVVEDEDASGLDKEAAVDPQDQILPDPDKTVVPSSVDNPDWGTSSFEPGDSNVSNVARRAALFDLPDPSDTDKDPFADTDVSERVSATAPEVTQQIVQEENFESDDVEEQPFEPKKRRFKIFGKKVQQPSNTDDTWFGSDDDWKGGAATRKDLRLEGNAAPSSDEAIEAVTDLLNDDDLISHDIWFVATSASDTGHDGIKAFLANHRREIRGAYLINLEAIGYGDLTVLTREGVVDSRNVNRRIYKDLQSVAETLHIDLSADNYTWDETDATVAMKSAVRSVTIMGLDDAKMPALSRTKDDHISEIDSRQIESVKQLVIELIRRS